VPKPLHQGTLSDFETFLLTKMFAGNIGPFTGAFFILRDIECQMIGSLAHVRPVRYATRSGALQTRDRYKRRVF
jgi:hypothetical protein